MSDEGLARILSRHMNLDMVASKGSEERHIECPRCSPRGRDGLGDGRRMCGPCRGRLTYRGFKRNLQEPRFGR